MSSRLNEIRQGLEAVQNQILEKNDKRAALIAVSKTYPIEDILLAYQCGQRHFGENKVQDLLEKASALEKSTPGARWHFIGSLQSNKINMLLRTPNLVSIHSIDSIKLLNKLLAKEFDKNLSADSPIEGLESEETSAKIGLFLQYNTSKEAEKSGFEDFDSLREAAQMIRGNKRFYLQGLMTMGAIRTEDFELSAKNSFEELFRLKGLLESELGLSALELSMGMSQDYPIALEAGTDWIRVGTKIFGKRA